MRRLNKESIQEIESFTQANRSKLDQDNFFKSQYDKQNVFHLLPGHKAIILGIPEQIKEYEIIETEKKKIKSSERPQRKVVADDDLKKHLISNLVNYFSKINFALPENILSEQNLMDFERDPNDIDYHCRFTCPFCEKILPISFKGYWRSGNITNHLKAHVIVEQQRKQVTNIG